MHDQPLVGQVSVARAAQLLTEAGDKIDRSALSRYCDTHGLKLGARGREVLVDYETVAAHRTANYTREVMSGQPIVRAALAPAAAPLPVDSNVHMIPGANDPARGIKELDYRRRQREELEAEGLLARIEEVDAGVAEAIVEMRAAFASAGLDAAEKLAAELGVPAERMRTIRVHLKRFAMAGQDRFAQRMARALAARGEGVEGAEARLIALAAHALRLRGRKPAPAAVTA